MYSAEMVARREARLLAAVPGLRAQFPDGLPTPSLSDSQALTAAILQSTAADGTRVRPYTPEEDAFVAACQLRIQFDFDFFATRFIWIDEEGHGLRPLYPLWESQAYLLRLLGKLELEHDDYGSSDGLLVNILKIRQVGITTLGVALIAHRIFTRPYMRALVGSDIEAQAGYLFRIAERVYVNLPPFLQPRKIGYNKDRELLLSNSSSLRTAWGKSTRGALQDVGGKKGNIERGRTYPLVHISELATWDHPDQLDTALLPGIPRSPHTLVLFESTAELADDWWHRHWRTSQAGTGRFRNLFVGAYAVPSKYSLRPPLTWTPKDSTIAWAAKAERESPTWCFGETIRPTLAQCYWYESTRDFYETKGKLHEFLREYPSDPEECFQYAGTTIFTHPQLQAIDEAGSKRKIQDIWTVAPAREIAALRREQPPDPTEKRKPAPLTPSLPSPVAHLTVPVPAGYGFQRVSHADLRARQETALPPHPRFADWLVIWEPPRPRGPRRYVMSVDVADGLGLDYSVIDLIRLPTIEEPAEQVAQWLSNTVAAKDLAFVCDALGRYYVDSEGIEALAAIEINNHGQATQDLLQLHLGYTNFYVWEYVDAASPERRFSTRIGWLTSPRTRPLLLSAFHSAVTTLDPLTGTPDFILNSPVTRAELRHLVTEGTLGEAEAARGQHDDGVMAAAIGYYVAYRLAGGETEPIAEKRRRREALQALSLDQGRPRPDWRNLAVTSEEADRGSEDDDDTTPDERISIDDYFFH